MQKDDSEKKSWSVYLILCADNSLYCGISVDARKRFAAHTAGRGARYTRSHLPQEMRIVAHFPDRGSALKAEARIKKMRSAEKRILWEGAAESGCRV